MGLLDFDDTYKPPFSPPSFEKKNTDNLRELNNYGRKEVTEDYSDSPHADRRPHHEEGDMA